MIEYSGTLRRNRWEDSSGRVRRRNASLSYQMRMTRSSTWLAKHRDIVNRIQSSWASESLRFRINASNNVKSSSSVRVESHNCYRNEKEDRRV